MSLTAVSDTFKPQSSKFYLKPCSNSEKHPDEFYICYYNTPDETKTVTLEDQQADGDYYEPVPFYLQTPVSTLGTNDGPLQFRVYNREQDCRLVLQSSLVKRHQSPVSLSTWMSGKEMCFIKCARRRSKNAFLAVSLVGHKHNVKVHCVNSRENASLFQIVQTDVFWQKKREEYIYSFAPRFRNLDRSDSSSQLSSPTSTLPSPLTSLGIIPPGSREPYMWPPRLVEEKHNEVQVRSVKSPTSPPKETEQENEPVVNEHNAI